MNLPYELRAWQRTAAMKFAEVAARVPNCRAIVQAATGAGKSRLCYAIGLALGRRFFIVVHLDTLAAQFEEEAKRLFPTLKVGIVKAARSEVDADLVIVSAQTMKDPDRIAALRASEERRGPFALQVHDECFPAGTLVDGRPIESFKVNDRITGWQSTIGLVSSRVSRTFRSRPSAMVRVTIAGEAICCTPGHPFWTKKGWVCASSLTSAHTVLRYSHEQENDVRPMWRRDGQEEMAIGATALCPVHRDSDRGTERETALASLRYAVYDMREDDDHLHVPAKNHGQEGSCLLFRGVQADQLEQGPFCGDGQDEPTLLFGAHEGEESDASCRRSRAGVEATPGDRPQTHRSRREWPRHDCGREAAGRRAWVDGAVHPNAPTARQRVSALLQGGPRPFGDKIGHRGGWRFTLLSGGQGKGREEGRLPSWVGVDRIEVLEPGGDGTFGGVCPDGHVYNVEVEGVHTYLANDIVVHNCHHATEGSTYHKIIDAFPDVPALGLSATLRRTDKKDLAVVWKDGVCSRYPIPAAQADGVLVPVTDGRGGPKNVPHRLVVPGIDVKAAIAADKRGDKEGARKAVGDVAWPVVAKETAFMCEQGRKTIVFCPDVDSSRIVAEFAVQLGVKAAAVDGRGDKDLPKKEVKRRLKAFRAGELQALVSCQILLEGFDQRDVRSVIWARQTESESVYIQGVGRGLRADPESGKTDCAISDLVGAHEAHGLVTGESLFLDPAETAEPDAAEVAEALGVGEKKPDEAEDRRTVLWKSFLSCLAGTRSLAAVTRSNVLWLPVKDNACYALPGSDGATYGLESAGDDRWVVVKEPRRRKGEAPVPAVRLCRPCSREEAQAVAERAARAGEGIDARDAAWRSSPASQEQLDALARSRVAVHGALTKGEASDLLCISAYRAKKWTRRERGVVAGGAGAFEVES